MKKAYTLTISALILLAVGVGYVYAYTTTMHFEAQCSGATTLGTSAGESAEACVTYCAGLTAGCCTAQLTESEGVATYTCTAKTQTTYSAKADTYSSGCSGGETCVYRHWDAYVLDYASGGGGGGGGGSSQPDLTATVPVLVSGSLYVGHTLIFIATTTNGGTAAASQHYSNRFQIDLNSDGAYDITVDQASSTNTLAASASAAVQMDVWTATEGTHRIRMCTDLPPGSAGVVPESNEDNNCGAELSFTVSTEAPGTTYDTTEDAVCSGGTELGTTRLFGEINDYHNAGEVCVEYCAAIGAACCTEDKWIFNDSWNPEPLSQIRYTCTGYTGTDITPQASTYRSTPPPGSGHFREYIESWSATLISYSSALSSAITANAIALTLGDSSLLTWTSSGATACTGTGFAAGAGTSGSSLIAPTVTTDYFITCAATTGTWQFDTAYTTSLSCPISDTTVRNTYSAIPDCPSSPSGASCTGGICKVNTTVGCSIETEVYECRDGYGNTLASTTDSVRVEVIDVLAVSCAASPGEAAIGDTVTWTSTVTGGVAGYTYVWTGADGLEGDSQTVEQSYASVGTKTATLTVTSADEEVTVSCDPVVVSEGTDTDLSASTPSLQSGVNEVGNSVTFLGTITNVGNNTVSDSFENRFQVDVDADGSYDFALDVPLDTYSIPLGGTFAVVSPAWADLPGGLHRIRFCSDLPPYTDGRVAESNENNNCSATMTLAVGESLLDMTITASSERVVTGTDVTITWSAVNADSCTVSGPGLSSSDLVGAQTVSVAQESTYTITCTRGSVTDSQSVFVRLAPRYEEI